jgi:hypothetical protein
VGPRTPRRYRLLGGIFGWRVPVVSLVLVLGAAWAREWAAVCIVSVIGLMAWEVDRAPVVEISRTGLARGFALPNGALAGAHVVSWRFVDAIETRWARPNDFTVLETIVRAPGGTVRFSSRMGLRAYRRVLREVQRRAPQARHLGLTDELLTERRRRRPIPVLAVVATLLAVMGLVAFYV